jgi:hypothetical protein
MSKFLVAFKGYKKYQIEAPDAIRAEQWAELQLKVWKREYKASITPIIEEKPAPVTEETATVAPKSSTTRPRKAKREKKNGN